MANGPENMTNLELIKRKDIVMTMTKVQITNNVQIIKTYIKLVVTRKKGFATSARLVRFVRA